MKNGKNPTARQRAAIKASGLNVGNWLVVKDTPEKMVLVHRHSEKTTRTIYKDVN